MTGVVDESQLRKLCPDKRPIHKIHFSFLRKANTCIASVRGNIYHTQVPLDVQVSAVQHFTRLSKCGPCVF